MPRAGTQCSFGESAHLPLKLNSPGIIPPILASSLLALPTTVASFNSVNGPQWLQTVALWLSHGHLVYMLLYVGLISFFAFFYTAIVFNPVDTADNLKKYGGFIPGIRPGKNTAEYLDYVPARLTVLGALYLSVVCILPQLLISEYALPFYF